MLVAVLLNLYFFFLHSNLSFLYRHYLLLQPLPQTHVSLTPGQITSVHCIWLLKIFQGLQGYCISRVYSPPNPLHPHHEDNEKRTLIVLTRRRSMQLLSYRSWPTHIFTHSPIFRWSYRRKVCWWLDTNCTCLGFLQKATHLLVSTWIISSCFWKVHKE